jgi:hypothetical protein
MPRGNAKCKPEREKSGFDGRFPEIMKKRLAK